MQIYVEYSRTSRWRYQVLRMHCLGISCLEYPVSSLSKDCTQI